MFVLDGVLTRVHMTINKELTTKQIRTKYTFKDRKGNVFHSIAKIPKFYRDNLIFYNCLDNSALKGGNVDVYTDLDDPLLGKKLVPTVRGKQSPICDKCDLSSGCANPYMAPMGSDTPLITIVLDNISAKDDSRGLYTVGGNSKSIADIIHKHREATGVGLDDIRWTSIVRCKPPSGFTTAKIKIRANWCRSYAVDDIRRHRPKLIMPVGTAALGAFLSKSDAGNWSGNILKYRGWPDDWLTEPKFMLNTVNPYYKKSKENPDQDMTIVGHPLFGRAPDMDDSSNWIPILPVQSPGLIFSMQDPELKEKWESDIVKALKLAKEGVNFPSYKREWFNISEDPNEIVGYLDDLIKNKNTEVAFDTETTGLKQWKKGESIVFMMFRWERNGKPMSIGFPWDYEESALLKDIDFVKPFVKEALFSSRIIAHNASFDIQFVASNLGLSSREIEKLSRAVHADTHHMAYVLRQDRKSLGLERVASLFVPDMAGYEENMSLLIDLHGDELNPAKNKGGHYAKCPRDKWESYLKPYVMGDVEVAYLAYKNISYQLDATSGYEIPLASSKNLGKFRRYKTPSRKWVYENILKQSNSTLMSIMCRGMHVDIKFLEYMEESAPIQVLDAMSAVANSTGDVKSWVEECKHKDPGWEFDLENKAIIKELFFGVMGLPIQQLTKAGKDKYGDDMNAVMRGVKRGSIAKEDVYKYAAVDKFTLNKLMADHPDIRHMADYRHCYKTYTSFIRPLRNMRSVIDKKDREKEMHLCKDGKVHASFKLTGTSGGRLSCVDPNLQQLPSKSVVKRVYTSRFGNDGCIYTGDLSQIELRLMAALCGDENMVRAYHTGLDLHTLTSSFLFNEDYDSFSKENFERLQKQGKAKLAKDYEQKRKVGKTCNFLTGYGGGAAGLQVTLAGSGVYKTLDECVQILNVFFDSYPSLKKFLGYYRRFILENKCAVSVTGRVRFFDGIGGGNSKFESKAMRAGCNHVIQVTASDIMLTCLNCIEYLMRKDNLESVLVSTVHDSLIADVVVSELPVVHDIVNSVLNNIPDVLSMCLPGLDLSWLLVPLAGDMEVGVNYYDQIKLPLSEGSTIDWKNLLKESKLNSEG